MLFPLAIMHTIDAMRKGLNTYTAYAILSFSLFQNVVIAREKRQKSPVARANRGLFGS